MNTVIIPIMSAIPTSTPTTEAVQTIQDPPPIFLNPTDYVNDVFDHFIAPTITGETENIRSIRVYMYKKLVQDIVQQSLLTTPISDFSEIINICISALSRAQLLRNL